MFPPPFDETWDLQNICFYSKKIQSNRVPHYFCTYEGHFGKNTAVFSWEQTDQANALLPGDRTLKEIFD